MVARKKKLGVDPLDRACSTVDRGLDLDHRGQLWLPFTRYCAHKSSTRRYAAAVNICDPYACCVMIVLRQSSSIVLIMNNPPCTAVVVASYVHGVQSWKIIVRYRSFRTRLLLEFRSFRLCAPRVRNVYPA